MVDSALMEIYSLLGDENNNVLSFSAAKIAPRKKKDQDNVVHGEVEIAETSQAEAMS
jgi:hypothetical protein